MTYLTEKRNLPKDVAQELCDVFGGRIKSLQNAASKLESGVEFSSKLNQCFFFNQLFFFFFPSYSKIDSTRFCSSNRKNKMSNNYSRTNISIQDSLWIIKSK